MYRHLMGLAQQYFGEHDANSRLRLDSAEKLWEWMKAGGNSRLTSSNWQLHPGKDLFFRGQPNTDYALSSSLYRLCREQHTEPTTGHALRVDEQVMAVTERKILESMRDEGIGRLMTDGELLAVLQHHGIPTRLIDVSASPLEALFFAVDREDNADGRLFILHIHPNDAHQVDTTNFQSPALEWHNASHGEHRTKGEWTQRVALVDQAPLDPRMHAQRGRFLVGGLNKRYAGRSYRLNQTNVPGERFPEISTLGINFLASRMKKPNTRWNATGWTLRIAYAWKPELQERLKEVGISSDSMYPPLGEVRRLALKVAKDAVRDFAASGH